MPRSPRKNSVCYNDGINVSGGKPLHVQTLGLSLLLPFSAAIFILMNVDDETFYRLPVVREAMEKWDKYCTYIEQSILRDLSTQVSRYYVHMRVVLSPPRVQSLGYAGAVEARDSWS